ncbi:MAG: anaerobic sulfite reductase subunit B [Erysipelotrichaceae bacterium]|nr:anaerobic sulfite reductase subunit B [Erysipelotrichaceae bacterium]
MSNAYIPFPSTILDVIKHTAQEYTFRMSYTGDVLPGQFFEVSIPKYGEAPISVSGIGDGYIDLTIRKVGRVTNEVFEHYVGQKMLIRGPYGNGFDTGLYLGEETVVVAGGTGVSPVRGVIDALSKGESRDNKYVIVGFKSPDDMLFKDDIKQWDDTLNLTLTVDRATEGYEGNVGLVTQYIQDLPLSDPKTAKAVVVGPPAMMHFTIIELKKKGFVDENITVSYERKMCCGLGKCGHCRIGDQYICLDGPVFQYDKAKELLD